MQIIGYWAIAIDANGNPVVGGYYSNIGGQPRNRIARLNSSDGTADPTFNPNADGFVNAIAIDANNNPVVGGYFYQYRRATPQQNCPVEQQRRHGRC
jgi:hypothetical protein